MKNDNFGSSLAREIYGMTEHPVRILSCFFATPSKFWDVKANTWRGWFERYFGKSARWTYALPETFVKQMREADVIYLHGGDNGLMFELLDQYPQLQTYFEGKIVIGSSAGANYLSRHYWARRKQRVINGRGIIPYSVIVHYGSAEDGIPDTDWAGVEQLLGTMPEDIIKLREGHFQVIGR